MTIFSRRPARRRSATTQTTETLEQRYVLSSVNLVGNEIQIEGTSGNDQIEVYNEGENIRVRTRAAGEDWVMHTLFRGDVVTRLRIRGNAGDDRIDTDVFVTSRIWGGAGDDVIEGSNQRDIISGDSGNDRIYAGGGWDRVFGGTGADLIFGDDGKDELYGTNGWNRIYGGNGDDNIIGGVGNDVIDGGWGADTIFGHNGNDRIWGGDDFSDDDIDGGEGNDYLNGGNGDDTLDGSDGNDELYGAFGDDVLNGGDGNDELYGGIGEDRLIGEDGADYLSGEIGDDMLFGGIGEEDVLEGGFDNDRFLRWLSNPVIAEDVVVDADQDDAVINFTNSNGRRFDFAGDNFAEYAGGTFSDEEILEIDESLALLQQRTENTRLLKRSDGDQITFLRLGERTDGTGNFIAVNAGDDIYLANGSFNGPVGSTVIHEIAHNWDTPGETPWANGFRAISGWSTTQGPGQVQATSGADWFYNANSSFARNYGRFTPHEDVATMWEQYFSIYESAGEEGVLNSGRPTQLKLTSLNDFFNLMMG